MTMIQLPSSTCDEESALRLFSPVTSNEYRWFVLHTRSRQEKTVAADLLALGVDFFLPLMTRARYYGRRKRSVELPLFSGYVFVRGAHEQVYSIDRAKRLVGIIRVPIQQQLNWELGNLHLAIANKVVLDPYPMLKKGARVEVRSGPLRGLQGTIESHGSASRLVLQVEMLGRAVSLEVDASLLDLI
jgi:transcription termination/antitermination protein NusG